MRRIGSAPSRVWAAMFVLGALLPTFGYAQKRIDTRLDTDPLGTASSRGLQMDASGEAVYVSWTDVRNGSSDIYFNRSLDGGATWLTSDIRLDTDPPGAAISWGSAIAISGDSVYVSWIDTRNGSRDIYFNCSPDRGATWLDADVWLNTHHPDPASADFPRVAASGDSVYVTWQDTRNGQADIYMNRSLDSGATWETDDIRLDTDAPGARCSWVPQIAAFEDSVYVIWSDLRNQAFPLRLPTDIYFNRSLDRGATWLASDIRLDTELPSLGSSRFHRIAASRDSVYVTWLDNRNGFRDIYFNRSLDGGSTWLSSDMRLETSLPGSTRSEDPQIAAAGDAVYVTWSDSRIDPSLIGWDIYFNRSLDGGSTWLASDLRLDTDLPGVASSRVPQIAASGAKVYVTWHDGRHSPPFAFLHEVYFNYSQDAGSTWLDSDVRLNTNPPGFFDSEYPQIAASGDSVYVTWTDRRNGPNPLGFRQDPGFDIYFNIPFGAQPYGEGTLGTGDIIPRLEGTDSLTLGNTFTLSIKNGLGGAFGLLALGARNSKASIPFAGGSLLLDPIDHAMPILLNGTAGVAGAGTLDIEFNIPVDNAFLGFNVNFQAGLLDPSAVEGLSLSNAVETWIL